MRESESFAKLKLLLVLKSYFTILYNIYTKIILTPIDFLPFYQRLVLTINQHALTYQMFYLTVG